MLQLVTPVIRCVLFLIFLKRFTATPLNANYSLVLIGGGQYSINKELWNTVIELGGGKGFARFGIVASAADVNFIQLL
jgi:hypothetical protein